MTSNQTSGVHSWSNTLVAAKPPKSTHQPQHDQNRFFFFASSPWCAVCFLALGSAPLPPFPGQSLPVGVHLWFARRPPAIAGFQSFPLGVLAVSRSDSRRAGCCTPAQLQQLRTPATKVLTMGGLTRKFRPFSRHCTPPPLESFTPLLAHLVRREGGVQKVIP